MQMHRRCERPQFLDRSFGLSFRHRSRLLFLRFSLLSPVRQLYESQLRGVVVEWKDSSHPAANAGVTDVKQHRDS
jgi:hypothetical protein